MKTFLIILVALTMTSGAYASKARLLALGDDKDGSFFIDDFRNIFLNSAYIHNHKDTVFLEFGDNGNTVSTVETKLDTDNDQKAMGGFLKSHGNFVYGLYLGNESDTDNLLRSTAWTTATGNLGLVDNVTDLFFGGEAGGVKWGTNFVYSKNEDESAKTEDERMAVRLGMLMGNLEAFANISIANESSNNSTAGNEVKFDGSHGYHVGGSYQVGNFTPYVSYKDGSWDNINGTTKVEGSFTEIKAGVGHTHEVSSTSRIYTRLNYFSEEVELKYASNPAKAEIMRIPLTVAYEGDATSWLTLRGSVSTNLRGSRDTQNLNNSALQGAVQGVLRGRYNGGLTGNRDETIQDATVVSAGATLNFGKLKIDGLIGTSGNDGDAGGSTGNKVGVLALDRLLARVAMTYSF